MYVVSGRDVFGGAAQIVGAVLNQSVSAWASALAELLQYSSKGGVTEVHPSDKHTPPTPTGPAHAARL